MVRAGRFAVKGDAEADWLSILCRAQNEMEIAGVKAIDDGPRWRKQGCDLASVYPLASQSPLVQLQLIGSAVEL